MNAIATTAMPLNYDALERLGASIAKSGLFGIKTPDQAIALMMIAHAEGRHPALAARDYDIIQGRPAKKAEAMLRDFLEAGGKVQWHSLTDELADATFTHPQTGSVRIDWDMKRAATAGFAGKDNWKKYPRAMLRSRVISEGVRTLWPLATSGMYVPEEAADMPPKEHNGPTLDHADEREALNAEVPLRAAAAEMPRAPRVTEKQAAAQEGGKPERTDDQWNVWLGKLADACSVLYHRQELVEVGERATVRDALRDGPEWVQREISDILAANFKRLPENAPPDADALPEIVGEHLAAG